MKKIEALLVVHPCLEENRQTAVGTSADSPLASDPAACAPVASSPGPDYELLSVDWSMAQVDSVFGRESQHSGRVGDSGAVGNFVLGKRMPSAAVAAAVAAAAAAAVVAGGIGIVGHNHLFPPGQVVVVVHIHLCWVRVPYQGCPYHCASIGTIHDEDDLPA